MKLVTQIYYFFKKHGPFDFAWGFSQHQYLNSGWLHSHFM